MSPTGLRLNAALKSAISPLASRLAASSQATVRVSPSAIVPGSMPLPPERLLMPPPPAEALSVPLLSILRLVPAMSVSPCPPVTPPSRRCVYRRFRGRELVPTCPVGLAPARPAPIPTSESNAPAFIADRRSMPPAVASPLESAGESGRSLATPGVVSPCSWAASVPAPSNSSIRSRCRSMVSCCCSTSVSSSSSRVSISPDIGNE